MSIVRAKDALGNTVDPKRLYIAIDGFAGAEPGHVVRRGKRLSGSDELVQRYSRLFLPDELDNPVLKVHRLEREGWLAKRRNRRLQKT